jgi:hypothetical protein
MAVTLSGVSNGLTKVLLPYIQDSVPAQSIFYDQVKRNVTSTFINNTFFAPIRSSKQSGVTNLANDASQLVSGSASIGQAQIGVKIMTGTFDITKLVLEATKSTKGAVENQLTFQAKTLTKDYARNINRQLFGDSLGVVSEVAGSSSGTTFTIQLPSASDGDARGTLDYFGSVNGDIDPAEYLVAGQNIYVGSAGGGVFGTISSISGSTVTMGGTLSSAANNPIYIVDGDGLGAGTAEFSGVRAALSSSTGTTTYGGVARNTITWTPQVDTVAESLSINKMEKLYIRARKYAMPGDRYAIFANMTLYQKYCDLLTALRREVNKLDLTGGWTGVEFAAGAGKVGVFLDFDVPDGEVEIINFDSWTLCQVSDMGWMEDPGNGGGALFRKVNYLTYQATMAWFANVLCIAPAANARLAQKTA